MRMSHEDASLGILCSCLLHALPRPSPPTLPQSTHLLLVVISSGSRLRDGDALGHLHKRRGG